VSARARKPPTAPPRRPSLDDQPTTVFDADDTAESQADPTVVDRPVRPASRKEPAAPFQVISKKDPSAPIQVISKKDQSSPIQAISMKTPGTHEKPPLPDNPPTPILARPKLRAVSEMAAPKQQNLGNLASPYDPKAARARAMREYVIWGCLAVILASAIALVVWFTAR
jgi:hypothetical protein